MLPRDPLKERALGRWHGILPAVGIDASFLRGRHGPCPMCGGRDRFRFDNKGGRGTWFCNQCGAGDGIELVKQFQGVEFREAAKLIEAQIETAPVIAQKGSPAPTDAQKREEMRALWQRASAVTPADLAGRYLQDRTGLAEFPPALRFSPDERYADAGRRATWHPVMVAKVDPCDKAVVAGERAALHRTYLGAMGGKADVPSPRKMMGAMPTGAAVRLAPFTDILGIAEGIETALSASILFDVPCWAALTAGLLELWQPPEGVKAVYVFGDNDASSTGQAAAYKLAARLKAKGLDAIVELPTRIGQDWNDVLQAKRSRA